jgi:hypothetical protein
MHDVVVDLGGASHAEAVQDKVDAAVSGLAGVARVTLRGEVSPDVVIEPGRLRRPGSLDAWVVRLGDLSYGFDLAALAGEPTVRGQFVRDVTADASLDDELRRRILVTGLRALEGHDDLAVA